MHTTSLSFPLFLTYESDEPLGVGDMEAIRKEIESSLNNANSNAELDPHGYTIQCMGVGVGGPFTGSFTRPSSNKIPTSDEDALRYLFTGLSERGWSFLAYDDGGDDMELFQSIEGLVSAVLAVSNQVVVYLNHKEVKGAYIVLMAQDSPEDVLVDHSWVEPLNSDVSALWSIFN